MKLASYPCIMSGVCRLGVFCYQIVWLLVYTGLKNVIYIIKALTVAEWYISALDPWNSPYTKEQEGQRCPKRRVAHAGNKVSNCSH